jgi:hypothetical protein
LWGGLQRRIPKLSLLGYATLGVVAGLIINPYTPRSVTFAIEHALPKLVPAGDFVVGIGNEWYPYTGSALNRAAGAALVTVVVGLLPMVATLRYGRRWDGRVVGLALLAMFFTLLLVRSRRFVEYQPAFAVMFCAFAWSFQVPAALRDRISSRLPGWIGPVAWLALLAGALALMGPTIASAQGSARASRSVETYAGAARWLEANTPDGARVFSTDWDDFPLLFFQDVHNTYLIGLDPTYMYQYDPSLYLTWRSLTRGQIAMPSVVLRDRFATRYVVTDHDHPSFYETATADPSMHIVYRDASLTIFQVD